MDELLVNRPPIGERQPVTPGTGMVNHAALPGVRKRLLAGGEFDRQLDADVAHVLGHGVDFVSARFTQSLSPVILWSSPHPYAGMTEPCPKFTVSVDAVLALAGNTPGVTALALLRRAIDTLPDEPFHASRMRLPRLMLAELLSAIESGGG